MHIQDLVRSYQSKTDEELVRLAMDSHQLTPEANAALRGELARRAIDALDLVKQEHASVDRLQGATDQAHLVEAATSRNEEGVGGFVADVLRRYHAHFWFFVKLTFPAVVVGYLAIYFSGEEAREIARHLPRGVAILPHLTEILEIWVMNLAGYFVSWMVSSVLFGTICSSVRQIEEVQAVPSAADAIREVRERGGTFFRVSLLLFVLALVACIASFFVVMCVYWLSIQFHVRLTGLAVMVCSFGLTGLALLVLSRFALAVPAVVLSDCRVGEAMLLSDELTEGKWLALAALLSKSLIGGYVAGMSPFWLASWLLAGVSLPHWFAWVLTIASMAAVSVVEPTMFIGFVLLYLRGGAVLATTTLAMSRQAV